MKMKCELTVEADSVEEFKIIVKEKLAKCIIDTLPNQEGGSISFSGSTDSSGNSSATVTGTYTF